MSTGRSLDPSRLLVSDRKRPPPGGTRCSAPNPTYLGCLFRTHQGAGSCALQDPRVPEISRDTSLGAFFGTKSNGSGSFSWGALRLTWFQLDDLLQINSDLKGVVECQEGDKWRATRRGRIRSADGDESRIHGESRHSAVSRLLQTNGIHRTIILFN